jgi:hypothetical protein
VYVFVGVSVGLVPGQPTEDGVLVAVNVLVFVNVEVGVNVGVGVNFGKMLL